MVCGVAYSSMMENYRCGSIPAKTYGKNVRCRRYCSTYSFIVVLKRFATDPLIVSDLMSLDDVPKDEVGRPKEEVILEMVQRAIWGMLYADGGGLDIVAWA